MPSHMLEGGVLVKRSISFFPNRFSLPMPFARADQYDYSSIFHLLSIDISDGSS